MLKGQAATVVLTRANWSVATPLKFMVAGVVADAAKATEPLKVKGASGANGMAILNTSSVSAPNLASAGLASVSSSHFTVPPRTETLSTSTFQEVGGAPDGFGATFASFEGSFWPVTL